MKIMKKKEKDILVYSPADGKIVDIKKVPDETFSQEMIGKGIAIKINSPYIYSPIKGKVEAAFRTGHAYGIKTKYGPSILLHIGVDTVALNGEGFLRLIMQGEKVKPKSKLARVNWEILKKAKSSETLVIATNDSMEGYEIEMVAKIGQKVTKDDVLFKIIEKKEKDKKEEKKDGN
ncbi:MAG: putative phosphotransferase enzyme IIA component YpqE [Candidatus Hepatoplasma vulgare]|nr:MAG: putative phosphotransferase enzyme IIA component YpqE [Candidatus Hepatoplasma sp.]